MKPYYKDPTAWIAIANVDREARHEEAAADRPEPIKKEYEPRDPVDWRHVLASPNKQIRINKAWMFKAQMERVINESRKASGVLRDDSMEGYKEELP